MTINQMFALKPGQQIRIIPKMDKVATVHYIARCGIRWFGAIDNGYYKRTPYVQTTTDGGWFADQVGLIK